VEKKLRVAGMSCQKCVARVNKIIGKHEGTTGIHVSLEDKEAVFTYEEETDIQTIINAINDFGFNAAEKN
jgi:copper ion binding protein